VILVITVMMMMMMMMILLQTVDEEAGQHSDHDNRRHVNRRQLRTKSEDVQLSPAVAAAVNEYKRVRIGAQRTLNSSVIVIMNKIHVQTNTESVQCLSIRPIIIKFM